MAASPFLALTLDLKRLVAQAAGALGHPHPGPVAWGVWELLEDVWRRKDPSVSALLLTAWFGPDPKVPGVLVALGLLVVVGDRWELCAEEADRLLKTHKQRVAAGKVRAASAERSAGVMLASRSSDITSGPPAADQRTTSGEPALTPSTQHPAPSTQEDLPRAPPAEAAAEVMTLQPTKPDAKPRKPSEAEEFWAWYQNGRTEKTGLVREAAPDVVALRKWFKTAVSEVTLQRLYTAAARYVTAPRDDYWRQRGFPFKGFMSDNVWRQYVPPEVKSG